MLFVSLRGATLGVCLGEGGGGYKVFSYMYNLPTVCQLSTAVHVAINTFFAELLSQLAELRSESGCFRGVGQVLLEWVRKGSCKVRCCYMYIHLHCTCGTGMDTMYICTRIYSVHVQCVTCIHVHVGVRTVHVLYIHIVCVLYLSCSTAHAQ